MTFQSEIPAWTLFAYPVGSSTAVPLHRVDHTVEWTDRWQWQSWSVTMDFYAASFKLVIDSNRGADSCTQLGQLRLGGSFGSDESKDSTTSSNTKEQTSTMAGSGFSLGALILVAKGSPQSLRVEHLESLRSGSPTALGLSSHPGAGICLKYLTPRQFKEWNYIETEVRYSSPLEAVYSGGFVRINGVGQPLVLDVSFWKYFEGNTVNAVGAHPESGAETFIGGGGRSWTLNDDGSISASVHPDLVLGFGQPKHQ